MLDIKEKQNCSGCHACVNICPKHCIQMLPDSEGFLYPKIDYTQCVKCDCCEKVCPILNHKCSSLYSSQDAYAAYCNDFEVRKSSSSGGIFTLLAEEIISFGGVVFGASLSEDCHSVNHIYVETMEQLSALRGSKYVQSTIGLTYQKAKSFLDTGRRVLFTGTPCQIGGLYAFLGKDYENLITQDLICHGAPSPKMWEYYIDLRERQAGSKAKHVSFRSKNKGWKDYSVLINFENNMSYATIFRDDPYMKGFLSDLILRPSCYACAFKTKQRQADITLADFWGIQNLLPKLDDNLGTSIVWIHTGKGQELFQKIVSKLNYEKIEISQAIEYNPSAVTSVKEPKARKSFWETVKNEFPVDVVNKLCKRTKLQRVLRYLSRLKHKFIS